MTRFLNILMVTLIVGVYYVKNDGFNRADATAHAASETKTAAIASAPLAQPYVIKTAYAAPKPQRATFTPHSNNMSKIDLANAERRFMAQRLIASTLVRDVVLTQTAQLSPTAADPVLEISGSNVNARSAPTTDSDVLARLRRGTEVKGTGETDGAWAKVTVLETGDTVWIHSDFLARQS